MTAKNIVVLGVSLLVAGCASVPNNYAPITEQISRPAIDEIATASLGELMLEQGTATMTDGVYLPQENNVRGYILSEGFYPKSGEDDGRVFTGYQNQPSANGLGYVVVENGLTTPGYMPRSIRFERDKQETCVIAPGAYGISQPYCDTEYPYQFTSRPIVNANDFQQSLIYSGRVGDTIRVSYREFSGSMARSAFTNEAEYDLSSSNIIAYRGARIEVLDANNEEIRYKVLSNFNTK